MNIMKNHLKSTNYSYQNIQNHNMKDLLMQIIVEILKFFILILVRFITKLFLTYYIEVILVLYFSEFCRLSSLFYNYLLLTV